MARKRQRRARPPLKIIAGESLGRWSEEWAPLSLPSSDFRTDGQGVPRVGTSRASRLALAQERVQQDVKSPVSQARVVAAPARVRLRPEMARTVYPVIATRSTGVRASTMPRSGITALHSQRSLEARYKRYNGAVSLLRSVQRLVPLPFNAKRFLNKLGLPRWTVICLRRRARREVLHALGKVGRRGTGSGNARYSRRYYFNRSSAYSCGG